MGCLRKTPQFVGIIFSWLLWASDFAAGLKATARAAAAAKKKCKMDSSSESDDSDLDSDKDSGDDDFVRKTPKRKAHKALKDMDGVMVNIKFRRLHRKSRQWRC